MFLRYTSRIGHTRVKLQKEKYNSVQHLRLKKHMQEMMRIAPHDFKQAQEIANKILTIVPIHEANIIANHLLITDHDFRAVCQSSIVEQILRTTPHITWSPLLPCGSSVPTFRSVGINGRYGDPDEVFTTGMPTALFNTRSGSQSLVPASIATHQPIINDDNTFDTKLTIPSRYDMLGFVFGPNISTALNVGHVLGERYTAPHLRNKGDRFVYLIALKEGFNVGEAIYDGSGYIRNKAAGLNGEKGVSCQEDACEIGAGVYIPGSQIIGVRKVHANGELGPFIFNKNASQDVFFQMKGFADVIIFLEVNNVSELRMLEAVMLGEKDKIEDYNRHILDFHKLDKELTKQIQYEARNRDNPHTTISYLLREQHGTVYSENTIQHFSIYGQANRLKGSVKDGELTRASDVSFHPKKAKSEQELKRRAIKAKKKATESVQIDTTPIIATNKSRL